ncbi:hypothetical protein N658DRAFT_556514 [Parathielavia hyrcaniae]|uniref:Uncharacterized protein n=1 Tax=Parathielavia hyrcaniae TaxID=113614 RepID=A0AAN6Q6V5_9PEZI|nr:hypothetical protein N658DRAFT_556514 [Parathielavia hyrcaniae]
MPRGGTRMSRTSDFRAQSQAGTRQSSGSRLRFVVYLIGAQKHAGKSPGLRCLDPKKFSQFKDLVEHVAESHPNRILCPEPSCHRSFTRRDNLQAPIKEDHSAHPVKATRRTCQSEAVDDSGLCGWMAERSKAVDSTRITAHWSDWTSHAAHVAASFKKAPENGG